MIIEAIVSLYRTNIVHMTTPVLRRLNICKCNVSCLSTRCCIEVPVSSQEVREHADRDDTAYQVRAAEIVCGSKIGRDGIVL
jgi:hypothetical protein